MPSSPAHASATTSTPSVPGPGSAVEIQLGPDGGRARLTGESAPQHRVAEDRPEPLPVASVLILQPDEHVSNYHSHLLRRRGYEIVEAWHVDHAKAVTHESSSSSATSGLAPPVPTAGS